MGHSSMPPATSTIVAITYEAWADVPPQKWTVGGGNIQVAGEDFRFADGKQFIRNEAKVAVLKCPTGECPDPTPSAAMLATDDCSRTACIGLVEICCGSGKVM
jgi:hypothetical protein